MSLSASMAAKLAWSDGDAILVTPLGNEFGRGGAAIEADDPALPAERSRYEPSRHQEHGKGSPRSLPHPPARVTAGAPKTSPKPEPRCRSGQRPTPRSAARCEHREHWSVGARCWTAPRDSPDDLIGLLQQRPRDRQ